MVQNDVPGHVPLNVSRRPHNSPQQPPELNIKLADISMKDGPVTSCETGYRSNHGIEKFKSLFQTNIAIKENLFVCKKNALEAACK